MDFEGFLSRLKPSFMVGKLWGFGKFSASRRCSRNRKSSVKRGFERKYVFSHEQREGEHPTYIRADLPEKVREIKSQNGKDIWLYGGASLIQTSLTLIDQDQFSVDPFAVGNGKPLFEQLKKRLELVLVGSKTFWSGAIQLIYQPK